MSQNSEQIEAKLCAYLEGELDESGRAEIEKHLQQNPAHRKLLAEVGKTRDLLRALPRESAPPDICEAFQGQLERSVLLADLDDGAGSSTLKINRWPQYLAVAAVVMLAAGLGLVVYFGLPSGRPNQSYVIGGGAVANRGTNEEAATSQPTFADGANTALTRGGTTPDTSARPTTSANEFYTQSGRDAGGFAGMPGQLARTNLSESAAVVAAPAASAPAAATTGDLTVLAKRVQGSWDPKERERLFTVDNATAVATYKALGDVPDTALCYVVTTAQPSATAEQIGQQLSKLQVAWSAVPQPDPGAMNAKLGRMAIDVGLESLEARVTDTVTEQPTDLAQQPGGGAGGGEPPRPESVVAQRGAGAESRDGTAAVRKQDVSAAGAPGRPLVAARGPSTRPASDEDAAAQDKPAIKLTEPPVTQAYAYAGQGAVRPETMIVARGLTREQADSLQAAFGARQLEQQARLNVAAPAVVANEPAPNAPDVQREEAPVARRMALRTAVSGPTTAPADEHVIRAGDSLRLVMAQDRGEQTVTEQQVRADGSVSIPGVGAFKCEGLTVGQLKEQLASRPRAGTDNYAAGKLVDVTKVAPANDAAKQKAVDVDAVAAVTEADAGRRGMVRAREDVALRSRAAQAQATPAQAPAAAAHPAPAPSAAPAPSTGQARGGAAGAVGVAQQREAISPTAGATVAEMKDAETFGEARTDRAPSTAPAGDRFDVVILVRADSSATSATTPLASESSGEPSGKIERYEILTIQLGDAEADAANVRVGEDGTVELPKVGRVKAQGLTADDLRKEIAEKLRGGNAAEAESAKVAVRRVSGADASAARDADAKGQPPVNETPAPGAASKPADPAAPADTAK
jgi:protein involved in polysaccharide export with SLBB domain